MQFCNTKRTGTPKTALPALKVPDFDELMGMRGAFDDHDDQEGGGAGGGIHSSGGSGQGHLEVATLGGRMHYDLDLPLAAS